MSEPNRPVLLRRGRRSFTAHAVIAGIPGILCLPAGVSLLFDWPVAEPTVDLPARAFTGSAVAVICADLALFALVASALLGRAALAPALAHGGPVDSERVRAARRWCGIATLLGLGGYAAALTIGVIFSLVERDVLPTWLAVTSGALPLLLLLIVRRGLARDLLWLTRA